MGEDLENAMRDRSALRCIARDFEVRAIGNLQMLYEFSLSLLSNEVTCLLIVASFADTSWSCTYSGLLSSAPLEFLCSATAVQ